MKATLVLMLVVVTIGCYYCLPLYQDESEIKQGRDKFIFCLEIQAKQGPFDANSAELDTKNHCQMVDLNSLDCF